MFKRSAYIRIKISVMALNTQTYFWLFVFHVRATGMKGFYSIQKKNEYRIKNSDLGTLDTENTQI